MKTMHAPYRAIPTWSHAHERVYVVIDTPKISRNKYKFDTVLGAFKLAHVLPHGMSFPFDFGAIPQTIAEDGDPLDVLVMADEPTFVGCVLDVQLIGVLEAEQTQEHHTVRNDRLIGVPVTSVNPPAHHDITELSSDLLQQLEQFFVAYNAAHGRRFTPLHRRGARAAQALVIQASARYDDSEDE
jgi:inorganic pyrophosphatase